MITQTPPTDGWQLEASSADAYETYLAAAFAPCACALVALAEVGEGDRVLDVACGTGIVARHAAPLAGAAGRVVGLDLNGDMLRVAQRVSADARPGIEWRQGSAAALPFDPASFDVVLCEQGLQFFPDPLAALREMHRVLRPGGRAAFSVCRPISFCPAYATLAAALDRHVGGSAGAMMRSPFSVWTVPALRELVAAAGFAQSRVLIDAGSLRYPSVAEFLRREAASSPLAAEIGALPPPRRAALIGELEAALADRLDDDGFVCGLESYVVTGRRRD